MSSATEVDVLILGGSYAGVEVVYQLLRLSDGKPPSIAVIDRQEAHGYLPLVQERLCERIAPDETRVRTRDYVESIGGASYIQGEIEAFDPKSGSVRLADGSVARGRIVVVALGSTVAPPLMDPEDGSLQPYGTADGVSSQDVLVPYKSRRQFEAARSRLEQLLSSEPDDPTVVVVGGGISGVELAGELADLQRERPAGWAAPRVTLLSAGPRLMPGFAEGIGRRVEAALREQGVDVRLQARVVAAAPGRVTADEQGEMVDVPASIAFWAAGIRPADVLASLNLPRTEDGWLRVGPTLQCFATSTPTHPGILACGDAVRIVGGDGQWSTMQRAIECIWQAKTVATNALTLLKERRGYPDGVPPLRPHRLRETFFYGVSVGGKSYVAYRSMMFGLPAINRWFRRWLMRQYFARYEPLPGRQVAQVGSDAEQSAK